MENIHMMVSHIHGKELSIKLHLNTSSSTKCGEGKAQIATGRRHNNGSKEEAILLDFSEQNLNLLRIYLISGFFS